MRLGAIDQVAADAFAAMAVLDEEVVQFHAAFPFGGAVDGIEEGIADQFPARFSDEGGREGLVAEEVPVEFGGAVRVLSP